MASIADTSKRTRCPASVAVPAVAAVRIQVLKMRPRDVRLGFAGRPADDERRGGVGSIHDHPQEQGAAPEG
jgi:hypothetical protein